MKLLVRNIAKTTTEESLQTLFEAHGRVQYCNIVLDQLSGESKGFGFVELPKPGDAKAAVKNLNGVEFEGQTLRVKKAVKPKPGAQMYKATPNA